MKKDKAEEIWTEIGGKKAKIEQLPKELIEIVENFIEFLNKRIGVPFNDIEYTLVPHEYLQSTFPTPEECYYGLKENILHVTLDRKRLRDKMRKARNPFKTLLLFFFQYIALGVLLKNAGELRRGKIPSLSEKKQAVDLAKSYLSQKAKSFSENEI